MYILSADSLAFPPPEKADSTGLLAIGGDLSPERLVVSYASGIFPWFNEGEPYLWWCPDPRFVLYPEKLHIPRSLRPFLNQQVFSITLDRDFAAVIDECQKPRPNQNGTWITEDMKKAYIDLHRLGMAHSVEVWSDDQLAGGLYGVVLGQIFYGESMFTRMPNASKVGLVLLVWMLEKAGYHLIDCQMKTDHLQRFGASFIPRKQFLQSIAKYGVIETTGHYWNNVLETYRETGGYVYAARSFK